MLQVSELDGVIIGPHDLSCSLGIPEQYQATAFRQAVEGIIDRTSAAGKSAGIHMAYEDLGQEIAWGQRGANIVLHSADIMSFARTMRQEISLLRQGLGGHESSTDAPINI
jgi:4-hydroxy-2-oxoheptanedioate aldolase